MQLRIGTTAAALFALLASAAGAQDMAVSSAAAQGSLAGGLTIEAAPLHALGPTAIALVAFEITGDGGAWTLPPAENAGDGIWTQTADLPGAAPGSYDVVVYVLDHAGTEFVSDPIAVTLD